jgi:carbohydrate-binding DOMON domain-containing protein
MRLREIAFATTMLLSSAAFTSSFAQSSAVSEKTFDWIFFAIIGIPFIIALVGLLKPGLLEPLIREFPWEERNKR